MLGTAAHLGFVVQSIGLKERMDSISPVSATMVDIVFRASSWLIPVPLELCGGASAAYVARTSIGWRAALRVPLGCAHSGVLARCVP